MFKGKEGKTLYIDEEFDLSGSYDGPTVPTTADSTSGHVAVAKVVDRDAPIYLNGGDGDPNANSWYSDMFGCAALTMRVR